MNEEPRETIFALSSGAPPAAIAIVRVSGPAAGAAVAALAGAMPQARYATLRWLRDGAGNRLDRALLLWFPGPDTATGEDLAEFHLHGGKAVVAAVLAALGQVTGCRPAQPGEFTRRAFGNGRIDLLQAEGLADLLSAETDGMRRRALRLAEGGLSRVMEGWRERLLELAARAEAVLEFGGDDPDIAADPTLLPQLGVIEQEMAAMLAQPPAERLRDGVRVVVAGPPNAGKSTLVNALAGRDVALATPIPGTTRDLIEAPVMMGGIAMVLIDSAGLRDARDEVEQLGVERARRAIDSADIVLWLGDTGEAPDAPILLRIHAKADVDAPSANCDLAVSVHTGAGLAALQQALIAHACTLVPAVQADLSKSQQELIAATSQALRLAQGISDEAIIATLLREAVGTLDRTTGRLAVDAFLDTVFARFCIGK